MSKPIDDAAAISQAANNAWDSEHEEDRANFRLGFFAGVRWAEQQLAAQAPEPTSATLGEVPRWTDVIPDHDGDYLTASNDLDMSVDVLRRHQNRSAGRNKSWCYCPLPLNLPAVVGEPVFRGQAAAEPDLSWVKGVTHLEDGSVHLWDVDAWVNANFNQDIFTHVITRVVLHRTGKEKP